MRARSGVLVVAALEVRARRYEDEAAAPLRQWLADFRAELGAVKAALAT